MTAKLEILLGPSGAGKTTIIGEQNKSYRWTTRPIREGEVDTRTTDAALTHGLFVSEEEFSRQQQQLAAVHHYPRKNSGPRYGFALDEITKEVQRGKPVYEQVVDAQAAQELMKAARHLPSRQTLLLSSQFDIIRRMGNRTESDQKQRITRFERDLDEYVEAIASSDRVFFSNNAPISKQYAKLQVEWDLCLGRGSAGEITSDQFAEEIKAIEARMKSLRKTPESVFQPSWDAYDKKMDFDPTHVLMSHVVHFYGFYDHPDSVEMAAQAIDIPLVQAYNALLLPMAVASMYLEQFRFREYCEIAQRAYMFNEELFRWIDPEDNHQYELSAYASHVQEATTDHPVIAYVSRTISEVAELSAAHAHTIGLKIRDLHENMRHMDCHSPIMIAYTMKERAMLSDESESNEAKKPKPPYDLEKGYEIKLSPAQMARLDESIEHLEKDKSNYLIRIHNKNSEDGHGSY